MAELTEADLVQIANSPALAGGKFTRESEKEIDNKIIAYEEAFSASINVLQDMRRITAEDLGFTCNRQRKGL